MGIGEADRIRHKIEELQAQLATADTKLWRELLQEINLLILQLKNLLPQVETSQTTEADDHEVAARLHPPDPRGACLARQRSPLDNQPTGSAVQEGYASHPASNLGAWAKAAAGDASNPFGPYNDR